MSKSIYTKCSIFLTAFLFIYINYSTSAPVDISENPYFQFITDMNLNKCSLPTEVQLPFNTTEVNNFEYLSSYLEICQKTDSTKHNKEAVVLCKEIFDNVRNISCPTKTALPDINVKLSNNICKDFGAVKDSVPENDESLLKRLTDGLLCDIMCDKEFEKACQVLLWSFEVRKLIASLANLQEPGQSNVQDGDVINYNFKQDNTKEEGSSLQVGNQNPEEGKDINEVVESDGITEVPVSQELKVNSEQKFVEMVYPNKNEEQEKTVLPNQAVLEDQTDFKTGSQDIPGASKSTGSLKPSNVSLQKTTGTSNSNTVAKTKDEMTGDESNVQSMNDQLQDTVVNKQVLKQEETDVGIPKSSNNNVATNEQAQATNVDILNDKQVQDKKDKIPLNEHPLDNSNIPANPNIPVKDENTPNKEMPKEIDQNPNALENNLLPHESANEKSPNNAAITLNKNEQDPSNIDTLAQNKLQRTTNNEDKLTEKTHASITLSQTTKDTTKHQSVQETTLDVTSPPKEEIKEVQPQVNSGLKIVETQDETKAGSVTHDLVTVEGNSDVPPKVAEESDNTIPDTTGTSITSKQKLPEKTQNAKATAENPGDKSAIPSSLTETSTKTTVVLEKMEGGNDLRPPVDEEPDYDGGFYEGLKNKESNPYTQSSPAVAKDIISDQNEKPIDFPSRNSFGQDSNDMIGFPEEDGHFFFYFLSIILILMGGYLIFHNKQKIIALIVEGRHERNRRSHRVGYKKLETK